MRRSAAPFLVVEMDCEVSLQADVRVRWSWRYDSVVLGGYGLDCRVFIAIYVCQAQFIQVCSGVVLIFETDCEASVKTDVHVRWSWRYSFAVLGGHGLDCHIFIAFYVCQA